MFSLCFFAFHTMNFLDLQVPRVFVPLSNTYTISAYIHALWFHKCVYCSAIARNLILQRDIHHVIYKKSVSWYLLKSQITQLEIVHFCYLVCYLYLFNRVVYKVFIRRICWNFITYFLKPESFLLTQICYTRSKVY